MLDGLPVISEFMAANAQTLDDQDGDSSDWIEIFNAGDAAIDLGGYYLTDDAAELSKWQFPTEVLESGEFLVVFASSKDRSLPGGELHTNFKLASGGEYLALVETDATTIASEFTPTYPQQVDDVSYGIPTATTTIELVTPGAAARVLVPIDAALDPSGDDVIEGTWLDPNLDDSAGAWFDATTGIGFELGVGEITQIADSVADWSTSGTQGEDNWSYGYYNKTGDGNGAYGSSDFTQFPPSYWTNTVWDWPSGNPPFTLIGKQNITPNGTNSGDEQWAIRRYESEVSGSLEVSWQLSKSNLSRGGSGVTGRVFHNGVEVDSVVIAGTDNTGVDRSVIIPGVAVGDFIDIVVDPTGVDGLSDDTLDNSRLTATINGVSGIGSNIDPSGDITAAMHNIGSSAYIRIPFDIPQDAVFDSLTLSMKYDDGFVAYLNGQLVASSNAGDLAAVGFDSVATADRNADDVNTRETFDISSSSSLLRVGRNVLMIQGLNADATNDDFLIEPELIGTSLEIDPAAARYFVDPTPGETNGFGAEQVAPLIIDSTFTPKTLVATDFLATGAQARVLIPTTSSDDDAWFAADFDDTSPGWFDATTGIGFEDEGSLSVTLVADSVADYSLAGDQGAENWTYGYYNKSVDADGTYQSNNFLEFPADYFAGVVWDWPSGNPPNTLIGQKNINPNGDNSGDEHWAIRRYESEAAGDLTIEWKLLKSGLALGGNGVTGRVFHNGVEVDTATITGNDNSGITRLLVLNNVQTGDFIDFAVDSTGTDGVADDTSDASRLTATIVGASGLGSNIDPAGDIQSQMQNVGSSAYLRMTFDVSETTTYDQLTLDIQYDDGFIAYLNGQRVASGGVTDPDLARFDSVADGARDLDSATTFERFDLSDSVSLLRVGENVLAIHALNVSAGDADLLLSPRLSGSGLATQQSGGAIPQAGEAIIVTTEVVRTFAAIDDVILNYRAMFGATTSVAMTDDGMGDDATAGDGVYTATIPAGIAAAGEMVRWFMTASDTNALTSRLPLFERPLDSDEYLGTIIADPSVESSNLPVFHWFVQNPSGANTTGGARSSLFYNGEFYDNILFDIHGQSTRGGGFPVKSHDVDFNKGNRFRWTDDTRRMKDINLLTNWADKSKVRNTLAYEVFKNAGAPYHLAEPVRVQQNGQFYSVYDFVEDGDDRFLERLGLDPEGALYKGYNPLNSASGNEKKTRQFEGFEDLQALVDGSKLSGQARTNYFFDNINIPEVVNFLAALLISSGNDCCFKNYYVYRDTNGTEEWQFLPWDVDLTFGHRYTAAERYFNEDVYTTAPVGIGGSNAVLAALLNTPDFREMYLRRVRTLMDELLQPPGTPTEELRFEARIDELVALIDASDDPNPLLGSDDADLDYQRWGSWGNQFTVRQDVDNLKTNFFPARRDFLYNQRTVGNGGEIPGTESFRQTTLLAEDAAAVAIVPTNDSILSTWTGLPENEPFDDSAAAGWKQGTSGVGYDDGTGYNPFIGLDIQDRIDINGDGTNESNTVYSRYKFDLTDIPVFDALSLEMRFDDGFVAYLNGVEVARSNFTGTPTWDSKSDGIGAEASSAFASFDITSNMDLLRVGENILAIHGLNQAFSSSDMIIQPKILGGVIAPSTVDLQFGTIEFDPASGNQDEEYIEIINNGAASVDISGWKLTDAVGFTFQGGTVIPAGGTLYVSPNVNTFRARQSGPGGGQGLFIQGGYSGHISNVGERLELRDASDAVVLSTDTPAMPSPAQEFLRITELHYNPPGSGDDTEFIEFQNISTAGDLLDLTGVTITEGLDVPFVFASGTTLSAGEYVLVVKNTAAFLAAYPLVDPSAVAGEFVGSLRNSGETIHVDDADGGTIHEFKYEDGNAIDELDWYPETDGEGFSLVIVDPAGSISGWETGSGWRSSAEFGGSPGETDPPPTAGDINGDTVTDRGDLTQLVRNFGLATLSHRGLGDINGDRATSLVDLAMLQTDLTLSASASASRAPASNVSSVPSPLTTTPRLNADLVDVVLNRLTRRWSRDTARWQTTRRLLHQETRLGAENNSPVKSLGTEETPVLRAARTRSGRLLRGSRSWRGDISEDTFE